MQRALGATSRQLFPIGLGAMPLSIAGRPEPEQAEATIAAALEAGVELIDTADCYCLDDDFGHNERLVATTLRRLGRQDVLVSTKGGIVRPDGRWESDARPAALRAACEASLRRLQCEQLSLYHLHAPDPQIPFAESVEELARLREEGKIAAVGLSNVSREQAELAQRIVPVTTLQNRCNVYAKQDLRNGLVKWCEQQRITYLAYSAVGGHNGHVRLRDDEVLKTIANRHDTSVFCVALAWLLAKSPAVLPIPGASRPASIRASASATGITLSADEIAAIDALPDQ